MPLVAGLPTPSGSISSLVEAGIARRQSAARNLKTFVQIDVLEQRKTGRERPFINPALLALLIRGWHCGA